MSRQQPSAVCRLGVRPCNHAVAVGCRQHEPGNGFWTVMECGGFRRRQHRPMIVQACHEPELSVCACLSFLASVPAVAAADAFTVAPSAARASRPTVSTGVQMARSRSRTLGLTQHRCCEPQSSSVLLGHTPERHSGEIPKHVSHGSFSGFRDDDLSRSRPQQDGSHLAPAHRPPWSPRHPRPEPCHSGCRTRGPASGYPCRGETS